MTTTDLDDATAAIYDAPLRLRTNVVDALMAAKGVRTVQAQAERFGLNRTHWFEIRSGKVTPNLDTAMRVAVEAGTTVEVLFGRES